jgi:hypothetical protein
VPHERVIKEAKDISLNVVVRCVILYWNIVCDFTYRNKKFKTGATDKFGKQIRGLDQSETRD